MEKFDKWVIDKITGCIGFCTGYAKYSYRTPQIEIAPLEIKDGIPCSSYWCDPDRYDICEAPKKREVKL